MTAELINKFKKTVQPANVLQTTGMLSVTNSAGRSKLTTLATVDVQTNRGYTLVSNKLPEGMYTYCYCLVDARISLPVNTLYSIN